MEKEGYSLTDYVVMRGDVTLKERELNAADNLVFCLLSYLPFHEVVNGEERVSIRECRDRFLSAGTFSEKEWQKSSRLQVLNAAADTERFGPLKLYHCTEILSTDLDEQFAAMSVELNRRDRFIAFRGTDDTIVGWKEDFMISFTRIPAQESAKKYLEKETVPGFRYYVGGHSKGGFLAVYVSAAMPKAKQKRIIRIFDNDGPGICPDVMSTDIVDPIRNLVTRIEPAYDVIGKLFELKFPDTRIVVSSAAGIMEHDPASWRVKNGVELLTVPESNPACAWVNEVLDTWISGLNPEDRKAFVNDFFDSLAAGGASDVQEVMGKGFEEVLTSVINSSQQAKDAGWSLPKAAVTVSLARIRESFAKFQEKNQKKKEVYE